MVKIKNYCVTDIKNQNRRIRTAGDDFPSINDKEEYNKRLNDFTSKIADCRQELDVGNEESAIAILETIDPVEYIELVKSALLCFDVGSIKDELSKYPVDTKEYKDTIRRSAAGQCERIYNDYRKLYADISINGEGILFGVIDENMNMGRNFGGYVFSHVPNQ